MLCSRDRELAQTEATVKPKLKGILKLAGQYQNPLNNKFSQIYLVLITMHSYFINTPIECDFCCHLIPLKLKAKSS